jgi:hypothetical protein
LIFEEMKTTDKKDRVNSPVLVVRKDTKAIYGAGGTQEPWGSKSQAVSLDHTKKKGRRSLENKVMIETMHTCMHIVPVLYHSY